MKINNKIFVSSEVRGILKKENFWAFGEVYSTCRQSLMKALTVGVQYVPKIPISLISSCLFSLQCGDFNNEDGERFYYIHYEKEISGPVEGHNVGGLLLA